MLQVLLIDKKNPFYLATDGSDNSGLQKMNSLTVRIFDANRGGLTTWFLDMCLTSAYTAETIFSKLMKHSYVLELIGADVLLLVLTIYTSVNMGIHDSWVQQKDLNTLVCMINNYVCMVLVRMYAWYIYFIMINCSNSCHLG